MSIGINSDIDQNQRLDEIRHLYESPSVVPSCENEAEYQASQESLGTAMRILPRTVVFPSGRGSERRRPGNWAFAVLVLGTSVYFVAITAVAVGALFCLPFSSSDDPAASGRTRS